MDSLSSSVGKESTCSARDPGSIPGSGRSTAEGIGYPLQYSWASLVAQLAKNLPAMQETSVRFLGWEGPLEKGKATHSSILAWRIPGLHRIRHNWATFTLNLLLKFGFSSVQFSHSVMPNSLRPHELQHARPPCPSPTPGIHSNSCPSSPGCHPAISSSVVPSPPAPIPPSIRVFSNESTLRMRWPKYWSFSFSIIPSKEHPGLISFRMDWLDLQSRGLSRVFSNTTVQFTASILLHSAFFTVHTWPLEKP